MSTWEQKYRDYCRAISDGSWRGGRLDVGLTYYDNSPSNPFDDVYHAALGVKCADSAYPGQSRWSASPTTQRVFRGQLDHQWAVIPTMYRDEPKPAPEDIQGDIEDLTGFIRYLQTIRPNLTDEQGLAIAQHYSHEAHVKTWLLDWTWDPLVALFFASYGEKKPGSIGAVWALKKSEWDRLSDTGENRMGSIQVIEVQDVPRISAQRALFLDTSHPDLFEQYVPYTIWFRQTPGLVFEDLQSEVPITKAAFFPTDELTAAVKTHTPPIQPAPLDIAPLADASRSLSVDEYFGIVKSWCSGNGWAIKQATIPYLGALCDFHLRLQNHRDRVALTKRSLRCLQGATKQLTADPRGSMSLGRALDGNYLYDPGDNFLRQILKDVERDHELTSERFRKRI